MPAGVFNKPYPVYEVITILRCLYLKQSFDAKWKKLKELEPHEEARKKNGKLVQTTFNLCVKFEYANVINHHGGRLIFSTNHPPHLQSYQYLANLIAKCSISC